MKASDQSKETQPVKHVASKAWIAIGGLAGLVACIGVAIAGAQLWQSVSDSKAQDWAHATVVTVLEAQYKVQSEIATLQAGNVATGPTATAIAQELAQLESTIEALDQAKQEAEATLTSATKAAYIATTTPLATATAVPSSPSATATTLASPTVTSTRLPTNTPRSTDTPIIVPTATPISPTDEEARVEGWAIKITDAIPTLGKTGKLFETSLDVNYSAGRIILAGDDQGTGRMLVDDNLYIDITHPDGTTVSYIHFYDLNCSPVDLTNYFQVGNNTVDVRIENVDGSGEASAYWLVNLNPTPVILPYQIVDDMPTYPMPAAGSFFARYFYVDHNGSGRLLLAADADGQGITNVIGNLVVQVWRPDGSMRRYVRDSSPLSAMDLTAYFQPGLNLVHLRLENTGSSAGTGPFWLVHLPDLPVSLPFEITPAILTHAPPRGDVFGRYFWVNVNAGDHLFLSSTADGTGQVSVSGAFYLRFVHPDGSQVTYTHPDAAPGPVDVSAYFEPGLNLVHARLRNTGSSFDSSAIYLTRSGTPLPMAATQTPGWIVEITPGFLNENRGDGTVFFDQTFELDYQRGEVILSRYADGQGIANVDDTLIIDITRPDGTMTSSPFSGRMSPWRLTEKLQVGRNEIRVRLKETRDSSSSSSLWFYNQPPNPVTLPFKLTDEIPTANHGDGSDFFVRYAYVPYDGNGRLIVTRYGDGTGELWLDDVLKFTVINPDGTTRTVEYSSQQSPLDLTDLFAIGSNLIWFQLKETKDSSGSSSIWLTKLPAAPVDFPYMVTAGMPGENRGDGRYFIGRRFHINETGLSETIVSQYADGTSNISADDQLIIDVLRPDGSTARFTAGGDIAPFNLNPYLNIGLNLIQVRLKETRDSSRVSSIWINQVEP